VPMASTEAVAAIELVDATLGYPGVRVLEGVGLRVASGEFHAVVGDNGSGKSTLLRSLLGILPPLEGSCRRSEGARLAYVPQQMALDPRFPVSVAEVVRMGGWRGGGARLVEEPERIAEALGRVGLADQGGAGFGTLSGGQKQRVLLARALLSRPQILLLDEPTSGVDQRATARIHEVLDGLRGEGIGIAVVTHHPLALRGRADHACLVAGGVVRSLDPDHLLSPAGAAEYLA
jgi:ABC-type Mn2+/Zn2+ transport system ATPase subunit